MAADSEFGSGLFGPKPSLLRMFMGDLWREMGLWVWGKVEVGLGWNLERERKGLERESLAVVLVVVVEISGEVVEMVAMVLSILRCDVSTFTLCYILFWAGETETDKAPRFRIGK